MRYCYYTKDSYNNAFIESINSTQVRSGKVHESSVGQFTGLEDKNGTDIYEGDVLEFKNDLGRYHKSKIFYKGGGLCYSRHDDDIIKEPENIVFYEYCADMQGKGWITQFEVIGNIHNNPELLRKLEA